MPNPCPCTVSCVISLAPSSRPRTGLGVGLRPDRNRGPGSSQEAENEGLLTMSSGTVGAQDWRAVACLSPTGERLLCVGESSSQVRAAYTGAWGEVIRDEDRPTVRAISLQKWAGQFWSGTWEHQMYLAVPTARPRQARHGRSRRGRGGAGGRGGGTCQAEEEALRGSLTGRRCQCHEGGTAIPRAIHPNGRVRLPRG